MNYYTVHLDYETARRCGAEGTFQVITVEDDKGKDVTASLGIDAGTHYTSLDELRRQIAATVRRQVELMEV